MREEEESTGNENVINSNKGEEGGRGGSGTGVKMGIFREGQYQRRVRRGRKGVAKESRPESELDLTSVGEMFAPLLGNLCHFIYMKCSHCSQEPILEL